MLKKIYSNFIKIKYYFKRNCIFGKGAYVSINSNFENNVKVGNNSNIGKIFIGKYSYIGENCFFRNIKIGRYSSIANNVKQIIGKHPTSIFVSTHPIFYSLRYKGSYISTQKYEEFPKTKESIYTTIIGNDVWIGSDVLIIDGITVGNGAIVAAGSVVTKDVTPYSIVAGVPAKVIGNRFNERQIEVLESIKWWEKDESWIRENADDFENIENFINLYGDDKNECHTNCSSSL